MERTGRYGVDEMNKESSVPLYQQLIEIIKTQISSGELKPGDRIPTEMELSKLYDISRITVRKAVELLEEEEVLLKKQGIGTFVTAKKLKRDSTRFMGYTTNCEMEGLRPGAQLITVDLIDASLSYTEKLRLEEGEKVIRIIRLRTADDEPVMIEENYFPTKYAYLLKEDLTKSLYKILGDNGTYAASGVNRISICYANQEEAQYLGIPEGESLILWKGLCLDREGNPLHICKSKVNPKRYEINLHNN